MTVDDEIMLMQLMSEKVAKCSHKEISEVFKKLDTILNLCK